MSFKVVGFKMPSELSDKIDECVKNLGVQRTAWVRGVIVAALKKEGFEIDPELLKPKQGERTDLSEPKNLEKLKEHARTMQRKSVIANRLRAKNTYNR